VDLEAAKTVAGGVILLGFLIYGTFYAFWNTARRLREARRMEDMPTSRIRSAAQGYVELQGTGRILDKDVRSPLTSTPCLWWAYEVEEQRTDSQGHSTWVTIEEDDSADPFMIEDDTGKCIVHPAGAEVTTRDRRRWRGFKSHRHGPPQGLGAIFGPLFGSYRYTERLLPRDLPLYTLGLFRSHGEVGESILEKPAQSDQPFVLSALPQEELARRDRWQSAQSFFWFVMGAGVLTALGWLAVYAQTH
jgi:hypothetical protein